MSVSLAETRIWLGRFVLYVYLVWPAFTRLVIRRSPPINCTTFYFWQMSVDTAVVGNGINLHELIFLLILQFIIQHVLWGPLSQMLTFFLYNT